MAAFRDLVVGEPFNRWTVTGAPFRDDHGNKLYPCRCQCGTVRSIPPGNLIRERTTSCGCLQRDEALHARNDPKLRSMHHRWSSMIQRCTNPNNAKYPVYGGRGIRVCERWRGSFANFVADIGFPPPGMTLDRIDNDGDYTPENCRWATPMQQQNNQSKTTKIQAFGTTRTLSEWASVRGIPKATLRCRISRYGWTPEEALTREVHPWGRYSSGVGRTRCTGGSSASSRSTASRACSTRRR